MRRYKLTSLHAISDAANVVHRVPEDLTMDEYGDFLSTMVNQAGSLWQIANPPPVLARLYTSDPDLSQACVQFVPPTPPNGSGTAGRHGPSRAEA